jgi:hypothetical protein
VLMAAASKRTKARAVGRESLPSPSCRVDDASNPESGDHRRVAGADGMPLDQPTLAETEALLGDSEAAAV